MTYSKILLPFTSEPPSRLVLSVAGAVASKKGSELWLLHIQQSGTPDSAMRPMDTGTRIDPSSPERLEESGLLDTLSKLRKTTISRICLFSASGDPSLAILKAAEKHAPDVIIVESSQQNSWEVIRDGPFVTELIDRSPCDLIVVRADTHSPGGVQDAMKFAISLN